VRIVALVGALVLIASVLWDAFETVILPRTVSRRLRLARLYFRASWRIWAGFARKWGTEGSRERFLAIYGPLSLLGLLTVWALGLVVGFAGLQWAWGSHLRSADGLVHFDDDLYMSATTFFTLGLGDVLPVGRVARLLTAIEAGMGFAFLAVVISYFPVLYQSFARREARLTLLDAWAGSPPAAAEILRRLGRAGEMAALEPFLRDWEYWCSEILESHISYPVVSYFRSQHQRQSWVSALTTVLDVTALVVVGIDGLPTWQARLTFAIARHAAVDLAQVLHVRPVAGADRLTPDDLEQLRRQLEEVGLKPARSPESDERLAVLRRSYEPFVVGIGERTMMSVPDWLHKGPVRDNWRTSPRREGGPHF